MPEEGIVVESFCRLSDSLPYRKDTCYYHDQIVHSTCPYWQESYGTDASMYPSIPAARQKVYTQIYILRFPKDTSDQPFIYRLVKEYDIEFNILKADILLQREGIMIIELKGSTKSNVKAGLDYLREMGVQIERLAARIRRDDRNCFQCGACTGVCSSGALYIRRPEMAVVFDAEKCTGCSLCVPICPVRAMAVSLNGDWIFSEKYMV